MNQLKDQLWALNTEDHSQITSKNTQRKESRKSSNILKSARLFEAEMSKEKAEYLHY